jgi:hypothetical protein
VLEVQVIAYISRGMINAGRWTAVSSCSQYPNVSARQEVCTYYANAGAISFTQSNGFQPATRGWFAQRWWQALNAYWSVDRTP